MKRQFIAASRLMRDKYLNDENQIPGVAGYGYGTPLGFAHHPQRSCASPAQGCGATLETGLSGPQWIAFIASLLFLILTRPVEAVYDLVAVDIINHHGNTEFCLRLDTLDSNINQLYLAVTLDYQHYLFLSHNQANELTLTPLGAEQPPFFSLRGQPVGCVGPYPTDLLQPYKVFVAAGNSLMDSLGRGQYREIFSGTPSLPRPARNWTLLIYMIGSDMESRGRQASREILEMLEGSLQPGAQAGHIVLMTGGSSRTAWNRLKLGWIENGRYHILQDLGEQDMTEQRILEDFVARGRADFPANHAALVLWGNAYRSVGRDSSPDGNNGELSLSQLHDSFQRIAEAGKLEAVVYDTGLMGTLEVAHATLPATDTLIASAAVMPEEGLDYADLLGKLATVGDGKSLGRVLVDGYIAATRASGSHDRATVGLSVFDLSAMRAFSQSFSALTQELKTQILQNNSYADYAGLSTLFTRIANYLPPDETTGLPQAIDLGQFLDFIGVYLPQLGDLQARAARTRQAMNNWVPYSAGNNGGSSPQVAVGTTSSDDLPPDAQSTNDNLSGTMDALLTRKSSDNYDPWGEPYCKPGVAVCAPILHTWLKLTEDEILGVDGYYGQLIDGVVTVYFHQPVYRVGMDTQSLAATCPTDYPFPEYPHYCFTPQQACAYQLCSGSECRDITVLDENGHLQAEVWLGQESARLSFGQDEPGENWQVRGLTRENAPGREDNLYPGDLVTPMTRHITLATGQAERRNGTALTITRTPLLKRDCRLDNPAVIAGYFGYSGRPSFTELCNGAICADPEELIGFELQPY